jgi:hypothetical protein
MSAECCINIVNEEALNDLYEENCTMNLIINNIHLLSFYIVKY